MGYRIDGETRSGTYSASVLASSKTYPQAEIAPLCSITPPDLSGLRNSVSQRQLLGLEYS
jgi:hypothetical protein